MKRMKRLVPFLLLAVIVLVGTSQAFAGTGEMAGITTQGPTETQGIMAVILNLIAVIL
jgi:hypothetical protein